MGPDLARRSARHPIANSGPRCMERIASRRAQWDGVRFDVLNPGPWTNVAQTKENNRGCVLKISSRAGSILLPADIERESEWELTQNHDHDLSATVMLAPHHGSKTSSSMEFLRAVQPQIVMVSSGYRNRFGHPKDEILERYAAMGATVFRSDRDGAVTFRVGENGVRAEAHRQTHRRYWYGQ